MKELQRLARAAEYFEHPGRPAGSEQQLAALYAKWRRRCGCSTGLWLHLMLQSLAWIALIVL